MVSGRLSLPNRSSRSLREGMEGWCTVNDIKASRILICGDRNWKDLDMIKDKLLHYLTHMGGVVCVIEGEARGADTLGRLAAEGYGIEVLRFPANWGVFGKSAGPIRNRQMLT